MNNTRTKTIDSEDLVAIIRLLQLSDSALPIGSFSFSNTLESAAETLLVSDESTLEQYASEAVRTAAFTDGIAALVASKACTNNDKEALEQADATLLCSKLCDESRQMTLRMGRKLSEWGALLLDDPMTAWWSDRIKSGQVNGTCAVTQGIIFSVCGIAPQLLFCSICYGAANIILGAALRCTRTTHLSTQRILLHLGDEIEELYLEARDLGLDDMNAFAPQFDIMAALHEKGDKRLFMN